MGNRIEVYRDDFGWWRWRFVAGNNKKIANSGEGYTEMAGLESALLLLWPTPVPEYDKGLLISVFHGTTMMPIEYTL